MAERVPEHELLFRRDGHLSELSADRVLLGELSAAEQEAVQGHLEACAACRANLAELKAFDEGLRAPAGGLPALPELSAAADSSGANVVPFPGRSTSAGGAPRPASAVPVGSRGVWRRRYRLTLSFGAMALAASLLLLVAPWETGARGGPGGGATSDAGTRLKGRLDAAGVPDRSEPGRTVGSELQLEVYAQGAGGTRRARPGSQVRPGERLGFVVHAQRPGWLLVAGVDQRGEAYLCYPQGSTGEAARYRVRASGKPLDTAVQLDEVPGRERLVALLCPSPFAWDELRSTLTKAAGTVGAADQAPLPALRAGCQQVETSLLKAAPPAEAQ